MSLHRYLQQEDNDDEGGNKTFDLIAKIATNLLLFGLIFGLSATVEIRSLKHQIQNWRAIVTGVAMQFIVMPFLGFLAVFSLKSSGFSEVMGLTLLVVTSSPGGSYSNWYCALFNAELALSVAMTAVSTVLSIGLLPGNLVLYSHLAYGRDDEQADSVVSALDFGALFITLGVVITAILGGLYLSYRLTSQPDKEHTQRVRLWANRVGNILGICLILVSFFLSTGTTDGAETNFWSQPWTFYVGVAIPCVLGVTVSSLLARILRLAKPECMAIAIECCYQNTAIAVSVAVTMFSDPTERAAAVSVPLFYGGTQSVTLALYCLLMWKLGWSKAPSDVSICTMLFTSYQGDNYDDDQEEGDDAEAPVDGGKIPNDECTNAGEASPPASPNGVLGWFRRGGGSPTQNRPPPEAPAELDGVVKRMEEDEKDEHERSYIAPTIGNMNNNNNRILMTPTRNDRERDRLSSEDTPRTYASSPPATPNASTLRESYDIAAMDEQDYLPPL